MAVDFMKKRKIKMFDSMGSDEQYYLTALHCYVQDEYQAK